MVGMQCCRVPWRIGAKVQTCETELSSSSEMIVAPKGQWGAEACCTAGCGRAHADPSCFGCAAMAEPAISRSTRLVSGTSTQLLLLGIHDGFCHRSRVFDLDLPATALEEAVDGALTQTCLILSRLAEQRERAFFFARETDVCALCTSQ